MLGSAMFDSPPIFASSTRFGHRLSFEPVLASCKITHIAFHLGSSFTSLMLDGRLASQLQEYRS